MARRLLLLLVLLLVPATSAAAAPVAVGIADQKPAMFGDARFGALGIRHVRLNLRWDALRDRAARAQLDAWMAGAKASGARPLVTFDRSPRRPSYDPSPGQLAGVLRALRARYPFVRELSTWNEANLGKRPELVARWWLALRAACRTCTVLGADLLDRPNAVSWAQRFERAARRRVGIWGLHNYADANRLSTRSTRALLRGVRGTVWFTETGGIVRRDNGSSVRFPTGAGRAARVTRFIFDRLVRLSPRVRRVYLYHWDTGAGRPPTWDSGFVGPDDRERPALGVLRRVLQRVR